MLRCLDMHTRQRFLFLDSISLVLVGCGFIFSIRKDLEKVRLQRRHIFFKEKVAFKTMCFPYVFDKKFKQKIIKNFLDETRLFS